MATKKTKTTTSSTTGDASPKRIRSARELSIAKIVEENEGKLTTDLQKNPYQTDIQLGLPIPFPIQYLIGRNVLQLGVVMEANGPPASCKTMFMFEVGRWFTECDGYLEMIVTESKLSVGLAHSIIGHDFARSQCFIPWRAKDLDHMMSLTQDAIKRTIATAALKHPDTGKLIGATFPVLIGIDSIMGTNAAESNKKMDEEGSSGRAFPLEALKLTTFMKKIASNIMNLPMVVFLINHRKESKPDKAYGATEYTKPGGKQIQFQDTYEFVLHADSGKAHKRVDRSANGGLEINGRTITIETGKNSSGQDRRTIEVDVSFRTRAVDVEQPDGSIIRMPKQITKFDWDSSTTKLIYNWYDPPKTLKTSKAALDERREKLNSIFHIRKVTGGKYWSKTLGMAESDAMSARAFGRTLALSPDILQSLQIAFSIETGQAWESGKVDFTRERLKLATASAKFNKQRAEQGLVDILAGIGDLDDDE